ncbi:MAG: hypothetical protein ACYDB7_02135 [Mycobacteriales bacterium]
MYRRKPLRRSAWVALGPILALASAGCLFHPPKPSVHFGVDGFPANVLYGSDTVAATAAGLPVPLNPPAAAAFANSQAAGSTGPAGPGPVVTPSVGQPSTFALPSLPAPCPAPRSKQLPYPVIPKVVAAPVAASYPFRSTIAYKATSSAVPALNLSFKFPLTETRTVSDVSSSGSTIDFTVTQDYPQANLTEATTYQVTTTTAVPDGYADYVPTSALQGLAITRQSTTTSSGTSTLSWTPALQLLKFPATTGTQWYVAGTDLSSGTTENYDASIASEDQVNACGTRLQGYTVRLTSGTITSPAQQQTTSFTSAYTIAPQFGGLVIGDTTTATTTTATYTATETFTDLINVSPKLPAGSGG